MARQPLSTPIESPPTEGVNVIRSLSPHNRVIAVAPLRLNPDSAQIDVVPLGKPKPINCPARKAFTLLGHNAASLLPTGEPPNKIWC